MKTATASASTTTENSEMSEAEWLTSTEPTKMLGHLMRNHCHSHYRQLNLDRSLVSDRKLALIREAFHAAAEPEPFAKTGVMGKCTVAHQTADEAKADIIREVAGNPFRRFVTTGLRVGSLVASASPIWPLHCGSGVYQNAVVVSLDPFALASESGDMLWTATRTPLDVRLVIDSYHRCQQAMDRWRRDKHAHVPNGLWQFLDPDWIRAGAAAARDNRVPVFQPGDGADGSQLNATVLLSIADAMERAGCDNQFILRHLRGDEQYLKPFEVIPPRVGWRPRHCCHVRGCWALDLILGEG